ncbi:MAG: sugar transporter permease, partial [Paenibacillus sp.]|nr:sugar transporter permease [Paenibacillus sp.]
MRTSWTSKLTSALFALPYTLCFAMFLLFPIGYGVYISFHDFELLSEE